MGAFNMATPTGTYSVQSDGAFSAVLYDNDGAEYPLTGQLLDDATATISMGDTLTMPLVKVMDEAACSGNWSGSFVQDETWTTYDIDLLSIDQSGAIQSCIGFTPPVSGRFYLEQGYFVAHLFTGETTGWNEIGVYDGDCVPAVSMSGIFGLDCSDCPGGIFTFEWTAP